MTAPTETPHESGNKTILRHMDAVEHRLHKRVRQVSWEFLLSQALMVVVAVCSVYIAAQEGLRQAVKFDRYQAAQRQVNGLTTIRREIDINREILTGNLRALRIFIIAGTEQELAKLQEEFAEREARVQAAQRELEQAEDRQREMKRRSLELASKSLAMTAEKKAEAETRLTNYGAHFTSPIPDAEKLDALGKPLNHIDPEIIERAIWDNLSQQDFLYEFDADLIAELTRFYEESKAAEKPLLGQGDWNEYYPTRVTLVGHAVRREKHLLVMLDRLIEKIIPRIDALKAAKQAVIDAYSE